MFLIFFVFIIKLTKCTIFKIFVPEKSASSLVHLPFVSRSSPVGGLLRKSLLFLRFPVRGSDLHRRLPYTNLIITREGLSRNGNHDIYFRLTLVHLLGHLIIYFARTQFQDTIDIKKMGVPYLPQEAVGIAQIADKSRPHYRGRLLTYSGYFRNFLHFLRPNKFANAKNHMSMRLEVRPNLAHLRGLAGATFELRLQRYYKYFIFANFGSGFCAGNSTFVNFSTLCAKKDTPCPRPHGVGMGNGEK